MLRERLADDIYIFRSERYAQVTAGAIVTGEGVALIDTLYYPDETLAVKQFIEERLQLPLRYLINTHYHADHTAGNYFYAGVPTIAHRLCYDLLDSRGREELARNDGPFNPFAEVEIVLPQVLLEKGEMALYLGGKELLLEHRPGHSPDLITVYVPNDDVLFTSDAVMPLPTIFDGSLADAVASLQAISSQEPDFLVQGHGPVLLRGEVQRSLQENIEYLLKMEQQVHALVDQGQPPADLESITPERCGKSRLLLNGLAGDLHLANLYHLLSELRMEERVS